VTVDNGSNMVKCAERLDDRGEKLTKRRKKKTNPVSKRRNQRPNHNTRTNTVLTQENRISDDSDADKRSDKDDSDYELDECLEISASDSDFSDQSDYNRKEDNTDESLDERMRLESLEDEKLADEFADRVFQNITEANLFPNVTL
jgi:hypothetical protein